MSGAFGWVRRFIRELRRRQVIRVAAVYGTTAFVILQLGEILVEPFGLGNWALRLVLFLLVLGFPLAIGLAWVYNITGEGLVRTEEGADAAAEMGHGGKPLTSNGLLVGLLVVAIGLLLYPRVFSSEESSGQVSPTTPDTAQIGERSIAILPFENMGGEESAQFTRGVHDDLLTRLSNVSALKVISRTSVEKYRDTDLSLPAIADSLGAKWIVEGGVQQAEGQVRVNAQLIHPETDVHRWADSYQRDLSAEGFFAIQGEIAGEIANALTAKLTPEEQKRIAGAPTGDLKAYELYVQGRRELARRSQGDLEKAVRLFRQAIRQDSSFALAWSGLADAAGDRWWGYAGFGTLDVSPEEAARTAVELAPNLAEARASMGLVHYRQRSGVASLREFRRAVELKPSYAEAHNWLGRTYLVLGRPEEGLRHLELAKELNPQHLLARHFLYDTYVMRGQPRRALEEIGEQQRRYPAYTGPYAAETRALYSLGRYEEARQAMEEAASMGRSVPWHQVYVAAIETATGDTARARKRLAKLRDMETSPTNMAYAHAAFGDVEKTLSALEAIKDWAYVPTFTLRYMTFPDGISKIRTDPRYDALLREVNRYWGLEPDGSIPEGADVSFDSKTDA